jgi:hypothetical protein
VLPVAEEGSTRRGELQFEQNIADPKEDEGD